MNIAAVYRVIFATVLIGALAGILAGSTIAIWRTRRWPDPPVMVLAVAVCLVCLVGAACALWCAAGTGS